MRRLPFILLVAADAALALFLLFTGARGVARADGMEEGLLAMLVAGAGVVTGLAALPALRWGKRSDQLPRRRYVRQLGVAGVIAATPWVVGAQFVWPAEWRTPRSVRLVCFNPKSPYPHEEIGRMKGSRVILDSLFEPNVREVSRDFVYIVPQPGGHERAFPMDCSAGRRCRTTSVPEADMLRVVATLPPCAP